MRFLKIIGLISMLVSGLAMAAPSTPSIYTEDKPAIMVSKDQPLFIVRLKANPSTGYNWFLQEYDDKILAPVKHQYEAPNTQLVGASGYDVWTFSVKPGAFIVPRMTQMRFVYARPWETQGGQGKQIVFRVSTQ